MRLKIGEVSIDEATGEEIHWVSKTEMKEEMDQLQNLGNFLIAMKPVLLEQIPLDHVLYDAIVEGRKFKNEAYRRHLQYVGKLMRSQPNLAEIHAAIDKVQNKNARTTHEAQKFDTYCLSIIEREPLKFDDILETNPSMERQHLGQLIRQAKKSKEIATSAAFKKFRQYMKDHI